MGKPGSKGRTDRSTPEIRLKLTPVPGTETVTLEYVAGGPLISIEVQSGRGDMREVILGPKDCSTVVVKFGSGRG